MGHTPEPGRDTPPVGGFFLPPGRTAIPYANEHACRVRQPDEFQEGSFRRIRREADGKDLFLIVGRLKGETSTTLQAFRYPRTQWTEGQARRHCRDHEGQGFEPATGEETMESFDFAEFEKRLREAELTALTAYKDGKADAPVLYRADGSVKPGGGDGAMLFVASQESEDRFGDVIIAEGWELENFKKNPVFMFCHDHSLAPIGTFPRVWVDGKQLLAQPKWDDEDEFARFIHGKYDRGVMRGISVGFRALEFADREDKKGVEFKRQELLELSAVPIPAHPAALRKAMGDRRFTIVIPSEMPITLSGKEVTEPSVGDSTSFVSLTERHPLDDDAFLRGLITWAKAHPDVKVSMERRESLDDCCGDDVMKGVIGWSSAHPNGTPKAAQDADWDAGEEVAAADVDDLKVMCAWVDGENTDLKTAYKFPHHRAGGGHPVVFRACAQGIAVLNGGRGGADIPDSDRRGVWNHVARHIRDDFEAEAAPLRAFGEEDEAAEEERERKENLLTEVGEILAGLKRQLTHEKEGNNE